MCASLLSYLLAFYLIKFQMKAKTGNTFLYLSFGMQDNNLEKEISHIIPYLMAQRIGSPPGLRDYCILDKG